MEIQESSLPGFYISRIFGCAPFIIKKNDKGRIEDIRRSLWLCVYSVCFLTAMVCLIVRFIIIDAHSKNPIRMRSTTSNFVTVFDVCVVVGACVSGSMAGLIGIKNIKKINKNINEVDNELATLTDSLKDRQRNLIIIFGVFTFVSITIILDIFSKLRNVKKFKDKLQKENKETDDIHMENYIPNYVLYFIMMTLQIQFAQTALGLKRRYHRLNLAIRNKLNSTNLFTRKSYIFSQLSHAHAILSETAKQISSTFGLTLLALLASCLLHLVAVGYFLFTELLSNDPDMFVASLQLIWFTFHLFRLLLIVEPSHTVTIEAGKTIIIVSELLRHCINVPEEKILRRFWRQLLADQTSFSACGLCKIDREILTKFSGAITTYLVILIQFQKANG